MFGRGFHAHDYSDRDAIVMRCCFFDSRKMDPGIRRGDSWIASLTLAMTKNMHTHSEIVVLPYTPQQMFELVVDIEQYPRFLPWCRAARVIERQAEYFIGELVISFNHLTERYTSKVTAMAPQETPSPLAGEGGGERWKILYFRI